MRPFGCAFLQGYFDSAWTLPVECGLLNLVLAHMLFALCVGMVRVCVLQVRRDWILVSRAKVKDISLQRGGILIDCDATSTRTLSFTSFLEETDPSFIKKHEFLIDETAGPSTLGSNCRFLIFVFRPIYSLACRVFR